VKPRLGGGTTSGVKGAAATRTTAAPARPGTEPLRTGVEPTNAK
jgi:hypothetical protein